MSDSAVNNAVSRSRLHGKIMNQPENKHTYAQTTSTNTYPIHSQAIIIHATDNLKLQDYVLNVRLHVGPANILFSARISNNRICIYLKTSQLADQFTTSHPSITIGNVILKVRKLINLSKKLTISNVSPHIPHSAIEHALMKQKLKLSSPVSFMRAGFSDEQYKHILSFHRQVYILPDVPDEEIDNFTLPESLLINFENEQFRIFLSTDDHWCNICKSTDHNTSNCTTHTTATNSKETSSRESQKPPANETSLPKDPLAHSTLVDTSLLAEDGILENSLNQDMDLEEEDREEEELTYQDQKGSKRPISSTPDPTSKASPQTPATKKNKATEDDTQQNAPTLTQILAPLKNIIDQQNKTLKHSLNTSQIIKLIDSSKQTSTAREAIKSLQIKQLNVQAISTQLQMIHGKIIDRRVKICNTKLLDKVKKEFKDGDVSNNAVEP